MPFVQIQLILVHLLAAIATTRLATLFMQATVAVHGLWHLPGGKLRDVFRDSFDSVLDALDHAWNVLLDNDSLIGSCSVSRGSSILASAGCTMDSSAGFNAGFGLCFAVGAAAVDFLRGGIVGTKSSPDMVPLGSHAKGALLLVDEVVRMSSSISLHFRKLSLEVQGALNETAVAIAHCSASDQ